MADLKISQLNSLAGADLVAADVVAVVDDSASETKKLTVSDLIANGVTLISDATIPSAKILFSAGSIATASVADAGITTAKVADDAITAAKLANNSSVTLVSTLPDSGAFTGQIALDTDDDKIYIWDGSAWDSVKGAGSINVVNGSTSGEVNIVASTSGDTVTISATLDDTSSAAQFLAGPVGAGGSVGYRAIVSGDLPTATSSAKGAVQVNGSGLTLSGDEIQIDNTVTANSSSHHLVQYDANGLVTAGRDITAADLPAATDSTIGGVAPGTGLEVTSDGDLNHENSVTAGTYTKVTVDAQGHVSAGDTLAASDVPDIDAAKITTGTFATARLANDAVTGEKLADQSTCKFGGAGATDNVVTFPDGDYKGQLFFDEKNEDLYIYTSESFLPITVISGNLVNAGTYNADTNLLSSVTTAGSAAGFESGSALPDPASGNLNYYVVVDESGTGSGNAPAVALAPPDMLISLGTGSAFQLIDVSNAIAGQTATNISVVASGNIAATNVQAALQELDTEKLALAGGTMTGNLNLGEDVVLTFEGATDDGFETTLTTVDATADRTLSLPNATGTLISTGDTGTVTSTMILDGTIANADISASAEIAVSKLANGSARQLLQTDVAGTGVEFTSNVDVPGTLDVTGAATLDSTLDVTGATTVTGVINADGKVKFPAGTAGAPSFYNGTDTDTGLYFSAANEISVATGGTQRVVVNSSGNFGIGAASPAQRLHVASGASTYVQVQNTGDSVNAYYGVDTGGAWVGASTNHPLKLHTNNTERLRIDGTGQLYFGGTSNSTAKVNLGNATDGGSIYVRAPGNQPTWSAFRVINTSDSEANSAVIYSNGGAYFAGDIGIGITAPDYNFQLAKDSAVLAINATNQSASSTSTLLFRNKDNVGDTRNVGSIAGLTTADGGNGALVFKTAASGSQSERLRITSTGAWAIEGASNYGTSGQVLTSNGNDSPTWQDAAGGSTDKIEEGNTSVECEDSGSDGAIRFTIEGTQVGVFDSAGNLDCDNAVRGGTTSSTGIFSGDFRSNATAASGFGALYAQNNQSGGRVWTGANSAGSYTSEIFENGNCQFVGTALFNKDSTNGKFNIDSNGEVQIGTTFNTGSTSAQGVYISSGAVGSFGGVRVQSTSTATSVGQFFAAYRGSTLVFNVSTGGNLSCTGSLSKGSGSFKIDHPLKSKTHHLVHSFVESPQADNIYRGKVDLVDGTAAVNIDAVAGMTEGTFAALNREIQCFTTNETGWTAIKGSVTGNILTITAQDDACTDSISWLVIGERQDQHMYDTEWTDDNGKVIVEPLK